jgi:hypothetical protein
MKLSHFLHKPGLVIKYNRSEFNRLATTVCSVCDWWGDIEIPLSQRGQGDYNPISLKLHTVLIGKLAERMEKKWITAREREMSKFRFRHDDALVFMAVFSFPPIRKIVNEQSSFDALIINTTYTLLQQYYA